MKTIKIYNYEELSEVAKSNAIERLRDINTNGFDWWNGIYEDAKTVGIVILGFDEHNIEAEIEDLEETAKLITLNHGEQCETYKAAIRFMHPLDMDVQADRMSLEHLFRHDINAEYLKMISNEYGYRTSTEAIIETIKSNDYHFSSAGKLMAEDDAVVNEPNTRTSEVWDFVEANYPNYHSCIDIATNSDMQVLADEGSNDVEPMLSYSLIEIYERAIQGFLNKK